MASSEVSLPGKTHPQLSFKRPHTRRVVHSHTKVKNDSKIQLANKSKATSLTDIDSGSTNGYFGSKHDSGGRGQRVDQPDMPIHPSTYYQGRSDLLAKSAESIKDTVDGDIYCHFTTLDFLASLASIAFFLYDFVSDIILAQRYFHENRYVAFGLTTGFIVFPALISNSQSLQWYKLDFRNEKGKPREERTSCFVWFLRIIFTMPFMLGPLVR